MRTKRWRTGELLRSVVLLLLVTSIMVGSGRTAEAIDPRVTVERAVDQIVAILTDPALKTSELRQERHQRVVATVENFFDFTEISMRVLGPRWRELNEEQRVKFVALFKQFLEKNYIDRVDDYSGEQMVVKAQEIREDRRGNRFAMVETDFITDSRQAVPVNYKLLQRDGAWVVYDVDIEGVSLVRNFRTQFDPYPFAELIRRMEEQIATGKELESL